MEIKIDFRRGAIGSLGIIAGPSEYVKEDIDREIKLEKGVWQLKNITKCYSRKVVEDEEMDEFVMTGSRYGTRIIKEICLAVVARSNHADFFLFELLLANMRLLT